MSADGDEKPSSEVESGLGGTGMTGAKSGNVAFKAGSYRERFVTVMGFSIILTDYKDNDERERNIFAF